MQQIILHFWALNIGVFDMFLPTTYIKLNFLTIFIAYVTLICPRSWELRSPNVKGVFPSTFKGAEVDKLTLYFSPRGLPLREKSPRMSG